MLTEKEKDLLRQIICSQSMSPDVLAYYAQKTEIEIKEAIEDWKLKKITRLQTQKKLLEDQITELTNTDN